MVKDDKPPPIKQEDLIDEGAAVIGTPCWIREGESRESGPFQLGEIVAKEGPDVYQIKVGDGKGKIVKKSLTELLGANEVRPNNMPDLTKLMYIHEAAVSDLLRCRYKQALIFTNVGAMLLVVNPFKDLGLVGNDRVLAYRRMPKKDIMGEQKEPHTFGLCAKSVHIFNEPGNDMNISFVISGESGAGKTESTKHIMSFFTTPADGSNQKDKISEAIMAGNPVLEAFGNATTVRNNNSSRFGRLIKMYIKILDYEDHDFGSMKYPVPQLFGADVTPYLLEKSRITHQASDKERNYHVFYQVLKGMDKSKLKEYKLPEDPTKMKYIEAGLINVPGRPPNHDEVEYVDMCCSFKLIGLNDEEIESVHRIIAAVLHVGSVVVQQVGDTENTLPVDWKPIRAVEQLFGLSEDAAGVGFYACCTCKYIVLPGDTKETSSPMNVKEAQNSLHSVARAVYEKVFLWLIAKINAAVKVTEPDATRWAAVLDIFGFEIMAVNSLEQLLINYANERLQQFFIENVFAAEKLEYSNEGIDPACVVYEDNMALIMVIDNEKAKDAEGQPLCLGIMKQLNSSCMSGSGTDATFLADVKKAGYNADLFEPGPGKYANEQFVLCHSMAKVPYTIANFREKNNEKLANKTVTMMLEAADKTLVGAFSAEEEEGGGGFTCQQSF
jgi:myosin heavy subunit